MFLALLIALMASAYNDTYLHAMKSFSYSSLQIKLLLILKNQARLLLH